MLADVNVLVIGNGRIGRVLTRQLEDLGATVCVASRGVRPTVRTVPTGHYGPFLQSCNAIVNTAPVPVLGCAELAQTRADCLLLDLASAPGGIDREAAAALGRRCRWELGLPGRCFPASAGRIIEETVLRVLS